MRSTHTSLAQRWLTSTLTAGCLCLPAVDVRAQGGGLFTPVDAADAVTRAAPEPAVEVTGDVTTLRSRNVRIDMAGLAAARASAAEGAAPRASLTLNLFDDAVFPVSVTGTEPTSSGGYSLTGRLDGVELGSLVVVVNGDVVAGTLQALPDTYTIRSAGDGVHVIRKVDLSTLPPAAEPLNIPAPVSGEPAPAASGAGDPPAAARSIAVPPEARSDDGSVIDVLVVYTAAAKWDEGGTAEIEALIDLAFAETNLAYADSNVSQRIRLAHKQRIDYDEGNAVLAIRHLQHPWDGFMDEVHELRDDHQTDLVALITGPVNWCGLAVIGPDKPSTGFSLTNVRCVSPRYVFAHELGHNMGLRHDIYVDDKVTPYPDNHGYVNQRAFVEGAPESARWRTIMAYRHQCSNEGDFICPTVLRFSNPEQSLGGDPLGVAGESDARRVLDATRETMARFRARATARLSPDPDAVTFRSDGVWRPFTVHAAEPIRVVANRDPGQRGSQAGDWSPRVDISASAPPGPCSPTKDEAVERGNGETIYLAACRSGAGIVTLVRAADDAPIRRYVLPTVDAEGRSASLSPDPATVPFANDGAWWPFTLSAADPIRLVANPPGTLRRIEIWDEPGAPDGRNFCGPEQNDTVVAHDGQAVHLAGCVPGEGTVHLVRDVDGTVLRSYALRVQALPDPCVEVLGNLLGTVTRAGSLSLDCTSTGARGTMWYSRYYTFSLERLSETRVDMTSPDIDTYLYVRDGAGSGGAWVAFNKTCDADDRHSCIDVRLQPGTYTVEASTFRSGVAGAFSLTLSAVPFTPRPFTDDPIEAGETVVEAEHVIELRQRIDAVLSRHGRPGFPWTDEILGPNVTPKVAHLLELRSALNQLYERTRRRSPSYTDPAVQAGVTPVRAMHFNELRRFLQLLE